MPQSLYQNNVFINCPFDSEYKPFFEAIVFAVFDCGFRARCSLEVEDSSQVRIEKIKRIIAECRFGIHDVSRTEPDANTGLPRFNMPLELGLFLGAKAFGQGNQKQKSCLILDGDPYRYQKFISDIAGQDIKSHGKKPEVTIAVVRDWLGDHSKRKNVPGGRHIQKRYKRFQKELPKLCDIMKIETEELTFNGYSSFVSKWLKKAGQQ